MARIDDAPPRFIFQIELQGNIADVSIQGDRLENGKASDLTNFDDDGRIKRKGIILTNFPGTFDNYIFMILELLMFKAFAGTLSTASAHIITAVIGSGVLSLAWATAQLGWIAGPAAMLAFSFVIYYTSCLLANCHRSPNPVSGKRNYTYIDAVRANLGMPAPSCK